MTSNLDLGGTGGIAVTGALSNINITTLDTSAQNLTIGSGGIDMSASTVDLLLGLRQKAGTWNDLINATASQTWTVAAGRTLTVGAPAGGGFSEARFVPTSGITVTVAGAGDTVLNTWTAQILWNLTKTGTGTLTTTSNPRIENGNVNVQGGVLSVQNTQLYLGHSRVSTSGAITVSGGGELELRNWGYGNFDLGLLRRSSDAIVFNGGTIRMNNGTAATSETRGFTIEAGGATLEANGSALWTLGAANDVVNTASGALTLTGSGNGRMDKALTGAASTATLTKDGTGTWTLGAANTYTGATIVNAGTLKLAANDVIPSASNVSIGTATLDRKSVV
jgi:autotransporter-associated beta strand protein